jgi:mannose-6-phosphate isomerase
MMHSEKEFIESATPPWGRWDVMLERPGYKVKQITVNPGHRLSYQKHAKRREHWVAVLGEGLIILEGKEHVLKPGESIDIPAEMLHRAINEKTEPFVFIEVQMGSYLGEDDIVRMEDSYGRSSSET